MLGGYRVQGLTADAARRMEDDARRLVQAGAFMIVVECVPDRVGALLSRSVPVPVIGIGAGPDCDGQVLVLHDMLGIKAGFSPRFVRRFAALGDEIARAASAYRDAVSSGSFPGPEHSFRMPDDEFVKLAELHGGRKS
jgi:3-methyl-2-oxobutanoate hydroxymethyltransferase